MIKKNVWLSSELRVRLNNCKVTAKAILPPFTFNFTRFYSLSRLILSPVSAAFPPTFHLFLTPPVIYSPTVASLTWGGGGAER